MAIRDRHEEIRAVPEPGALRRFWDDEVMWRAKALYHNDALNLPVKLVTGSRMDSPVTLGRVVQAAATVIPAARLWQGLRAETAASRIFSELVPNAVRFTKKGKIFKADVGRRLFSHANTIPTPTAEGLAAVDAAEAEYMAGVGGKVLGGMSRLAYPIRSLAESLFRTKTPEIGTGVRTLVDATSIGAELPIGYYAIKEKVSDIYGSWRAEAKKTAPEKADRNAAKDFVDSRTNSTPEQVSASLRQGSEDWILADAQARLLAAGGPTNETALAEFNGRVKPLRDREFKRLYGEMTGTDSRQFDFENDTLRKSPDMENANAVRERHRAAARRFKELTPDQWRTASWVPEGGN